MRKRSTRLEDQVPAPLGFSRECPQPATALHEVDDRRLAEAGQVVSVTLLVDHTQSWSQHKLFPVFSGGWRGQRAPTLNGTVDVR